MSYAVRLACITLALLLPLLTVTNVAADIREEQIIPPPPKHADFG